MQKAINETGAIYKCVFNNDLKDSCKPFLVDTMGNNQEENKEFTFNREKKDFQWLGASMDGGDDDDDKFVVSTIHSYIFFERKTQSVINN